MRRVDGRDEWNKTGGQLWRQTRTCKQRVFSDGYSGFPPKRRMNKSH